MRNLLIVLSGAALLAFSQHPAPGMQQGCEAREIRPGKEKGMQERFFAAPLAKVKEEMINALAALEFEVKKDKGSLIEAKKRRRIGVFVGSGGEKIVIQFAEAEQDGKLGTRVIAETKKGLMGRVGQKSWSSAVLDKTECLLQVRPS